PALINALALTAVHERLIEGRVPGGLEVLRELAERLGAKKVPAMRLVEASEALRAADQPDQAIDLLRRSDRAFVRLSSLDQVEARLLGHLVAAAAHRRLGAPDRAIREIRKAAAALPGSAGEGLRRLTLVLGVDQLLADGRMVEAERWIRTAHQRRIQEAREAAARVRGEAEGKPTKASPSSTEAGTGAPSQTPGAEQRSDQSSAVDPSSASTSA